MLKLNRVWTLLAVLWLSVVVVQAQTEPGAQGATSSSANAARLVRFSGSLRDRLGLPLTGTVGATVAIYKDQQGGTPLWVETQNVQLDAQGNYSLLLGATQSEGLPLDLFATGESRWLGVQAQLPGELEQPRVLLVSVPYALKAADADTLGGKPLSAFVLAAPTDNTGEQSPSTLDSGKRIVDRLATKAAISGATIQSASYLAEFNPACIKGGCTLINSPLIDSGGNVGIGTLTPTQKLDVAGNIDAIGNLMLPNTNGAGTTGVIALGGNRFLHNFGTNNTFVGQNAGNFTMSGANNTANGMSALSTITTGASNTAVGYNAGVTTVSGNAVTTGSLNTFIGAQAGPGIATQLTNAGAIGANAAVLASNSIVIGSITNLNGATSSANVGIGNPVPDANLDVEGTSEPAATGSNDGTAARFAFKVQGGQGGNATTGAGGLGGRVSIIAGPGGNSTSVKSGGNGGDINIRGGSGGTNSLGSNGLGGNVVINAGTSPSGSIGDGYVLLGTGTEHVGIGTSTPQAKFQVAGGDVLIGAVASTNPVAGENLYINNSGGDTGVNFRLDGYQNNLYIVARSNSGASAGGGVIIRTAGAGGGECCDRMAITPGGGVGIGTDTPGYLLDVNGTIHSSGLIWAQGYFYTNGYVQAGTNISAGGCVSYNGGSVGTCSSDVRFKKNIQPFSSVLNRVVQLQPVHYDWRTDEFPDYHFGSSRAAGLIAQEVEKVFPEMVSTDKNGYKQVNYGDIPYLLLQAVKELKAENDTLREQVTMLQARTNHPTNDDVAQLRREMEQLRALVAPMIAGRMPPK